MPINSVMVHSICYAFRFVAMPQKAKYGNYKISHKHKMNFHKPLCLSRVD